MKKYIATALLPLLLMMSACGTETSPDDNGVEENGIPNLSQTTGRIIVEGDSDIIIRKFTIDGTECVIVRYDGGISCGWDNPAPAPTNDSEFE